MGLTDRPVSHAGVTIFISTHFMNEGERCDRIALMHAGKVLTQDAPTALLRARSVQTLEEAFIAYLEEATAGEQGAGTNALPWSRRRHRWQRQPSDGGVSAPSAVVLCPP